MEVGNLREQSQSRKPCTCYQHSAHLVCRYPDVLLSLSAERSALDGCHAYARRVSVTQYCRDVSELVSFGYVLVETWQDWVAASRAFSAMKISAVHGGDSVLTIRGFQTRKGLGAEQIRIGVQLHSLLTLAFK